MFPRSATSSTDDKCLISLDVVTILERLPFKESLCLALVEIESEHFDPSLLIRRIPQALK